MKIAHQLSVKIKCPNCGHVQKSKIRKTLPFYTYIHECEKCKYVITESDWEEVK
jgi:rubredoxin